MESRKYDHVLFHCLLSISTSSSKLLQNSGSFYSLPLPRILRALSPSSYQLTSHSPLMAIEQDLSTPQCSAEERAWLLIHQARMRGKKSLVEAFNNQFPARESADILRHAASVRDDHKVHSQLQNLARQFPCIKIRRKREKVALSK